MAKTVLEFGVRLEMYAFGRCLKKDGWIISAYKAVGDRYVTLKIRRARPQAE